MGGGSEGTEGDEAEASGGALAMGAGGVGSLAGAGEEQANSESMGSRSAGRSRFRMGFVGYTSHACRNRQQQEVGERALLCHEGIFFEAARGRFGVRPPAGDIHGKPTRFLRYRD